MSLVTSPDSRSGPLHPQPDALAFQGTVWWLGGLALALFIGAVFRLGWPETIEYKLDEAWTYEHVRDFWHGGGLEPLGMPTSQRVRNPGMSLWAFYPLGAFGLDTPQGVTRGVQVLAIVALLGLVLFAWWVVPIDEREWWLWAVALAAVNPIHVLLQRKIWPPSVMPVAQVLLLACWWHRDRRWGAFGWGMLAAVMAQIHLSIVFLTVALAGWSLVWGRKPVAWMWGLVGAATGSVPALGWLHYLLTTPDRVGGNAFQLNRLVEVKFWTHWVTEPMGAGVDYFLGKASKELLAWPSIAGLAMFIGLAAGLWLMARAALRWARSPGRLTPPTTETGLLVSAAFWGYGLVLTLLCVRFYRHYLMAAFPLSGLWLAYLALPQGDGPGRRHGRLLLLLVCVSCAVLSWCLLTWLDTHGGASMGGFGISYGQQVRDGVVFVCPR